MPCARSITRRLVRAGGSRAGAAESVRRFDSPLQQLAPFETPALAWREADRAEEADIRAQSRHHAGALVTQSSFLRPIRCIFLEHACMFAHDALRGCQRPDVVACAHTRPTYLGVSGSGGGIGRDNTASATVNIAVLTPMPSPTVLPKPRSARNQIHLARQLLPAGRQPTHLLRSEGSCSNRAVDPARSAATPGNRTTASDPESFPAGRTRLRSIGAD